MSIASKKEKVEELRCLSVEQLKKKEEEVRRKLFDIKQQGFASGKTLIIEKSHLVKQYKKEIAHILMVIREKQ